ncbi:uncharacterized protein LOC126373455 [Pectinophora gossypiella]|uniref:uncharacterized protein LOC126373455 n=1 Tax=Pectinophora gossypiella TaxID=13191 RepID=UPI00214E94A8|nr:uncharacterized protein LOC126373455 [Pectinophora gossypiella]
MMTRSQTSKVLGGSKASKTHSNSSASSASTAARVKAAEAVRKQRLADIAKNEAAAAAAVAAAEREAVEASYEATVAALEAEEVMSARSSHTADWVASSDFAGAASITVGTAAPLGSFPCGQSVGTPIVHAAPAMEHVREATQGSPETVAVDAPVFLPCQLHKDDLHLQPQRYGNNTTSPVSDIEKLTNAIVSLAKPSERSECKVQLSSFSGNMSEWLLFKRTFDDTKASFSANENIARLRNALSGEAKEAVLSLLLCSTDPEPIMRSLESRFARPKQIVLNELASIRSLPKVGNSHSLAIFASRVKNCVSIVNLLGESPYLHSPELIHILVSKLNPLLQNKWCDYAAEHCVSGQPQIDIFARFLEVEADKQANFGVYEVFNVPPHGDKPRSPGPQLPGFSQRNPRSFHTASAHHVVSSSLEQPLTDVNMSSSCLYCSVSGHNIKCCPEFVALNICDRIAWVRENKLCVKCLRKGKHNYKFCKTKPCGINGCKQFHNKIIHSDNSKFPFHPIVNNVTSSVIPIATSTHVISDSTKKEIKPRNSKQGFMHTNEVLSHSENNITSTSYSCASGNDFSVLLKVLPVILSGPKGEVETFALLDDGSTVTLLDAELANKLGVSGTEENMCIETITGTSDNIPVKFVDFEIRGRYCNESYTVRKARAIPHLKLRPQEVTVKDTRFPHLLDIAAELVFDMATPKVLIGTSDWHLLLSRENRVGTAPQPAAIRTALGWVLFGNLPRSSFYGNSINHLSAASSSDIELESLIKDYYRLDSIGIKLDEKVSREDQRALDILNKTTRRLDDGRFEVGLPWREDEPHIPDSYHLALSRFQSLQRKLNKDEEYARLYKVNIEAYVEKGYAEECLDSHNSPSSSSRRWYLPHFGVTNPNKPGKLRIVHDASAKSSGVSLNTLILPGPDLLQSLLGILMRFREGQIALNGDIREMFPQIKIREEDRDCQRYIWLSPEGQLKEFHMTSLIFGASASPFTAIYIKNRNAKDFQDQYPEATRSIIQDHYMDDFLGSVDSPEEAARLAADILHVHAQCGFEMRSWVSNDTECLKHIPSHLWKEGTGNVDLNLGVSKPDVRVLGMHWNPQEDTFSFKVDVNIPLPSKFTKRQVLRDLMRIYDPLGLLQPKVTIGKILFQRTWRMVSSWDVPLPFSERIQWEEWYRDIKSVNAFNIPRAYKSISTFISQELHVFTDASEVAYTCVAYWRFLFEDGSVQIALIASKSRVAPLKSVSIPRLELQAALLGVRLAQTICSEHRGQASRRVFWSDSKTVLAWIRSDSRKYKAFVSHRLGEIAEHTQVSEWRWVPTAFNVADDATRLVSSSLERWWHGPSFLKDKEEAWPQITPSELSSSEVNSELRPREKVPDIYYVILSAEHFSTWQRLLRVTARVIQFTRLLKDKEARSGSSLCRGIRPLLARDVRDAEEFLLKQTQRDAFTEELACIKSGKFVSKKSRLHKIGPRLDDVGFLRAYGRISAVTEVSSEVTKPIILDGRHPTVRLLISDYHIKALHGNNETVVNNLRQKYAILHLRPTVRFVASRCQFCRIKRAQPVLPPTGDLPSERLQHHRPPFSFVGLDYLGPLEVTVKRSREKRYVALFTCLVTRAIHLEVVGSLTADSAIMALRRFIARRGCPVKILSDNGTAFVGANRILREAWAAVDHSHVMNFAASHNIEWQFIPPSAPSMGGAWERLVRSVKRGLSVVLREKAPREEILVTLLAEIENIVNSRPLTHVPVANEDEPALTPNHFLLRSFASLPTPESSNDDLISRQAWKKAIRLADEFWARWVKEYLPNLLPRGPSNAFSNLHVGDLVMICDGNLPRGVWPRGRVVRVFPGKDGVVRVAEVRTSAGVLRRPARKLAKLDLTP